MIKKINMIKAGKPPTSKQQGISLVIVMIFLVILSVLGISAMQGSTLSSRIARNEADRNLAFQAAEAALRDGELDARNLKVDITECTSNAVGCRTKIIDRATGGTNDFNDTCIDGLCCSSPSAGCGTAATVLPVWSVATRWDVGGASVRYGVYTGATPLPVVFRQPRYLIEYFAKTDAPVYRITAVGFGANDSTQVMLQSTIKVLK